MGVITRGSFAKSLAPGVKKCFGLTYNEYQPIYPKIYMQETSRRAFEEEVGATSFGLFSEKAEGSGIAYDSMQQGYVKRYTHITYAKGFIITREAYEDDLYPELIKYRSRNLAFAARETKETIHANILNRAFSSSYTGADGKELCATDHPNVSGGTYANELTTAADLSDAALESATIAIAKWTNDADLHIQVRPMLLIIPPDLEGEATRILKSTLVPDSANNAVNYINVNGKIPQGYQVWPHLTDTDAWFLKTDCMDGLKTYVREKDRLGTENDFDTENARFKMTMRFSAGWTDPKGIFGSPGA
jgi:phage major head subunit gpT-like protein